MEELKKDQQQKVTGGLEIAIPCEVFPGITLPYLGIGFSLLNFGRIPRCGKGMNPRTPVSPIPRPIELIGLGEELV